MSAAEAVAAIMFGAIVLYSVFAGADFGSGVWDLLAGNTRNGAPKRRLIDRAIGPVWEANHVWLIFVLVFLWTGFPRPFGQIMRDLPIPFWLAGLGIVLRGAGFAFRKYSPDIESARIAGAIFALSSVVTPFFLGSIAGAIASGRVGTNSGHIELSPTSIIGGVLAVATCAFLAAVFLVEEADRAGDALLVQWFRTRALTAAAATGAIALGGVLPLREDAPTLYDGLTGRALPLVIISVIAGLATGVLIFQNRFRPARFTAVVAVVSVVGGWGFGQYPWILVDSVEISEGAGHPATLKALLIVSGAAAVIVIPALALLYRLADSNELSH